MSTNYPQRWLAEHNASTSSVGWYRPTTYEVIKCQKGLLDEVVVEKVNLLIPNNVQANTTIPLNIKFTPSFTNNTNFKLEISNNKCTYDEATNMLTFGDITGDVSIKITLLNGGATDTKTVMIEKDSTSFIINEGNYIVQGTQKQITVQLLPLDTTEIVENVYSDSKQLSVFSLLHMTNLLSNKTFMVKSNTIGSYNIFVKTNKRTYKGKFHTVFSENDIVKTVKVDAPKYSLHNTYIEINPIFTPTTAKNKDFTITFSDDTLAKWLPASKQILVGSKDGIVKCTLTMLVGGASTTFNLNIVETDIIDNDINIVGLPEEIYAGTTHKISLVGVPEDIDISDAVVTVDDKYIEVLEDDNIKFIKQGVTSINIKSVISKVNKNVLVEIKPSKILIERFEIDIADEIAVNAIILMNVKVFPENAERLYTVSVEGNLDNQYDIIIGGSEYNAPSGKGTIIIKADDGSGVELRKEIDVTKMGIQTSLIYLSTTSEILNDGKRHDIKVETFPENPERTDIIFKVTGVLKLDGKKVYATEVGYGTLFAIDRLTGAYDEIEIKVYNKDIFASAISVNNGNTVIRVDEKVIIDFITVPEFARIPPYTVSQLPTDYLEHNKFDHTLKGLENHKENESTTVTINVPSLNYTYDFNVVVSSSLLIEPRSFEIEYPICLYYKSKYKIKLNLFDKNYNLITNFEDVDKRIFLFGDVKAKATDYKIEIINEGNQLYIILDLGIKSNIKSVDFGFVLPNNYTETKTLSVYNDTDFMSDFNFVTYFNQANYNSILTYDLNKYFLNETHRVEVEFVPKRYTTDNIVITSDKKIKNSTYYRGELFVTPLEEGEHTISVTINGITKTQKVNCVKNDKLIKNYKGKPFNYYRAIACIGDTVDIRKFYNFDNDPNDPFELMPSPYYEIDPNDKLKFVLKNINDGRSDYIYAVLRNSYSKMPLSITASVKPIDVKIPLFDRKDNKPTLLLNKGTFTKFNICFIKEYDNAEANKQSSSQLNPVDYLYFESDNPAIEFYTSPDEDYQHTHRYKINNLGDNRDFTITVKRVIDDTIVKTYKGKIVDDGYPIEDINVLFYSAERSYFYDYEVEGDISSQYYRTLSTLVTSIPNYSNPTNSELYSSDGDFGISKGYYDDWFGFGFYPKKEGKQSLTFKVKNYQKTLKFNVSSYSIHLDDAYIIHDTNLYLNDSLEQVLGDGYIVSNPEYKNYMLSSTYDYNFVDMKNCELITSFPIKIKLRNIDNTGTFSYSIQSKNNYKILNTSTGKILPNKKSGDIVIKQVKIDTYSGDRKNYNGLNNYLYFYSDDGSKLDLVDIYSDNGNKLVFDDKSTLNDGYIKYHVLAKESESTYLYFLHRSGKVSIVKRAYFVDNI